MKLNYNSLLCIKSFVKYPITNILDHFNVRNPYLQVVFVLYVVVILSCLCFYGINKLRNLYRGRNVALELWRAVEYDDKIQCIRLMEKYPQAINVPLQPENYTPFLKACLLGNTHLIKLMIKYGANLSLTTAKQETCFYLAVYSLVSNPRKKDASSIHTLYYAGVDINAPNCKGFTALHLAAMFGHSGLVQWLLTKGANKNISPPAYALARQQGHYHTASLLKTASVPCIQ